MRSDKIFKTLDEQVEILREKGLTINDVEKAKEVLLRENYFFLNGYRHLFMDSSSNNRFINGVKFEELHAMFLFDRAMRNIYFKWILVIENNFKSIISYILSKKYGFKDREYLNPRNFTQDSMKQRQVRDILNKMRRQIRVNGREHTATSHYINNYGYIPLWILVKVLSFGIMSEFYGILKEEDQLVVSDFYKSDPETISTYLTIIANYRNICAHEEILFDHRTQKTIPNNKYFQELGIPMTDNGYKYGSNDLFSLMIIMKKLLSESEFTDVVNEISYEVNRLDGRINSVSLEKLLDSCGFPTNWEELSNLE